MIGLVGLIGRRLRRGRGGLVIPAVGVLTVPRMICSSFSTVLGSRYWLYAPMAVKIQGIQQVNQPTTKPMILSVHCSSLKLTLRRLAPGMKFILMPSQRPMNGVQAAGIPAEASRQAPAPTG